MRDKKTVLKTYKRYLNKIRECEPSEVPTNFGKMMKFIVNETSSNKEFYGILARDCVYQTLKVVEKKNINLKELSEDWDTSTIKEVWRLQGLCQDSIFENDKNKEMINFNKMWTLIASEEDMALKLYLHLSHQRWDMKVKSMIFRDNPKEAPSYFFYSADSPKVKLWLSDIDNFEDETLTPAAAEIEATEP